MNLFLRVLYVYLSAWFRPRIKDILATSRLSMIVLPTDLDFNMHMNNGRYFTIMDLGRLDFLLRSPFATCVYYFKSVPILAASQIRYRFPLNVFQKYTLETRILGWDEKWFFIEQRFIYKNRITSVAIMKACFWNSANKTTVATHDLIEKTGFTLPSPALPAHILDWLMAEESLKNSTSNSFSNTKTETRETT